MNKPTGPVTPEGKAISSRNAIKHGLSSPRPVLPHENQSEYDALLASLQNEFQPDGAYEHFLIRQMTDAQWKLARAAKIETALFERMLDFDKSNPSPEDRMARQLSMGGADSLLKLQRYTSALERSYYKAHKELLAGRKTKSAEAKQTVSEPRNTACKTNSPSAQPRKIQNELPPPPPVIQYEKLITEHPEPRLDS